LPWHPLTLSTGGRGRGERGKRGGGKEIVLFVSSRAGLLGEALKGEKRRGEKKKDVRPLPYLNVGMNRYVLFRKGGGGREKKGKGLAGIVGN